MLRYQREVTDVFDRKVQSSFVDDNALTRAPNTKRSWSAPIDPDRIGHLRTGLNKVVKNPYSDESSYRTPEWKTILQGNDQITLQTLLEYKHGKQPGFYSDEIDLRAFEKKEPKFNFFQSEEAYLNFEDGGTVIDTDKQIEEVLYYSILEDPGIANSFNELTDSHDFYIASEESEQQRKTEGKKKRNAAISKLESIADTSSELVVQFAKVLNQPPTRKITLTSSQAYEAINNKLEEGSPDFIREFMGAYSLWESPSTRERFMAEVTISDGLDLNIFWIRGNSYFWQPPRDESDREQLPKEFARRSELIEFLTEKKYQVEQDQIEDQIKFKLRNL